MLTRLVLGGVLGCSGVVRAEPPAGDPVLGGPVAEERPEAPATLVRWGYDGRLERLDTTPEQAAVALLDLSPMERDAVDAILATRMAVFDRVVIESLDLAVRFESAKALKDWRAMGELIFAFAGRLAELAQGGTARTRIVGVLAEAEGERFERLVDEYHRAVLHDEKQQARREHRKFKPIETALRARGDELGREIERAIRRSAAMGDARFEIFLQAMGLEDDVETMIRSRTIEFAQQHDFAPSKEAQDAFFAELFVDLDRESRVKVVSGLLRYQSRGLDYGYGPGEMGADGKTGD